MVVQQSVCVCVCVCARARTLMSDSLRPHGLQYTRIPSLSMEFPRQVYWRGLPFSTPGDLPDPGIKPHLLHLLHWQADSLAVSHLGIVKGDFKNQFHRSLHFQSVAIFKYEIFDEETCIPHQYICCPCNTAQRRTPLGIKGNTFKTQPRTLA